jgi:hypothetical protein
LQQIVQGAPGILIADTKISSTPSNPTPHTQAEEEEDIASNMLELAPGCQTICGAGG